MESKPAKEIKWWELGSDEWQNKFPYLEKATLRLVAPHLEYAALRWVSYPLLKHGSEDVRDEVREKYFKPHASPEEKTIMVLADLVFALAYPENILPGIIDNAMGEIEEAYRVILHEGGGWSSPADKSKEKRKAAVLEWYRRNLVRLPYLKETYFQDSSLYEDRGGQEKRDFKARLIIKIINDVVHQELSFRKVNDHLKNLKE